jgi:hypothetical protein
VVAVPIRVETDDDAHTDLVVPLVDDHPAHAEVVAT